MPDRKKRLSPKRREAQPVGRRAFAGGREHYSADGVRESSVIVGGLKSRKKKEG